MRLRVPKPLHGWRQFVGEVGVIGLGVLLALSAEQLVQWWNDRQNADDARETLRAELLYDDLPQAYARLAVSPCLAAKLSELDRAEVDQLDRLKFLTMAKSYQPQVRTWDSEAWKAVTATGYLTKGGAPEIMRWASPYVWVGKLDLTANSEAQSLSDLVSLRPAAGQLSDAESDRVVITLQRLRKIGRTMFRQSWFVIEAARNAGVNLSVKDRREVLKSLTQTWGQCATPPALPPIELQSQIVPPITDPF